MTGGATTHHVWQASQVIAEHNGSTGAVVTDYVYSGSRMIANVSGGSTQYLLSDRLSARMTLNSSGSVLGRQAHLPFGEDFSENGAQEKHHFTSYERDGESGTDYGVNRQYSQSVGRFARIDPYIGSNDIGKPQTLNRYAYLQNDPVNGIDPLGLDKISCFWATLDRLNAGELGNRSTFVCVWITENEPRGQVNPCPDRYRRFFSNIALYRSMAIQLRTEVVFLLALSAYESGWLDNHNNALQNLFGVTNAGGNNLRYRSFQAAANDWVRRFGQYVSGAETMDQFTRGLRQVPPNGYNTVNPNYYTTLNAMINVVKRIAEKCGVDLTTPQGPPS